VSCLRYRVAGRVAVQGFLLGNTAALESALLADTACSSGCVVLSCVLAVECPHRLSGTVTKLEMRALAAHLLGELIASGSFALAG